MSVPVEDGEDAHERGGGQPWRARLAEYHGAERDGREGDSHLDAGHVHAEEREHPTQRHHHGEGHGQQPERGGAELGAPEADREHGDDVIRPGERVKQAADEARHLAARDVGERRVEAKHQSDAEHEHAPGPQHRFASLRAEEVRHGQFAGVYQMGDV